MATGETEPQTQPRISYLQTFLAAVGSVWFYVFDLVKVFAFFIHSAYGTALCELQSTRLRLKKIDLYSCYIRRPRLLLTFFGGVL